MNLMDHLDDDHAAIVGFLPEGLFDLSDIDAARATFAMLGEATPKPELPTGVSIEEHIAPGHDGDPGVAVRLYRPEGIEAAASALYWMHGGGWYWATTRSTKSSAPTGRWKPASSSCRWTIAWPQSTRFLLPSTTATRGCSGWPTTLTTWESRRRGSWWVGPALAVGWRRRWPTWPASAVGPTWPFSSWCTQCSTTATKHRAATPSPTFGSGTVRPTLPRGTPISAARPATAPSHPSPPRPGPTDLVGLPPAYINVGSLDLFVDEDTAYANALRQAGVAVELHVYPGAFHASNKFVAESELSLRWAADELDALKRAVAATTNR